MDKTVYGGVSAAVDQSRLNANICPLRLTPESLQTKK